MNKNRFYYVGDKSFSNKFMAFLESQETGKPLKFRLHEEEFDKCNWLEEPKETWDQLLDIRAQQIASLKKPIILAFSGGTDSYTMYEAFKRNDVKIDAMLIKTRDDPDEDIFYEKVLPYVRDEQKKYGFRVIFTPEDKRFLDNVYADEDWWQQDSPVRVQFSVATGFAEVDKTSYYDNSIHTDHIVVLGIDKPRIKVTDDGQFYSYMQDTTLGNFSDPRSEHFFISADLPALHIKQSYMLAKYIKGLQAKEQRPWSVYNQIHDPKYFNYNEYSYIGCGRYNDLARSDIQKMGNRTSSLILTRDKHHYVGRGKLALEAGIANNDTFALNYINGLKAMRSDSKLRNIFRDENNFYSVKDYDSKYYKLNV